MTGHGRRRLAVALETSTDRCSVAVLEPAGPRWRVLAERADEVARSHTRVTLRFIGEALDLAGAAPSDVGALAVGTGPGTFTGIRIGVATARALALGWQVPIAGVGSLSALAAEALAGGDVPEGVEVLAAAIDARRGQVFVERYRRIGSEASEWVTDAPVFTFAPDDLRARLFHEAGAPVFVVGDERVSDLSFKPSARALLEGQEFLVSDGGSGTGRQGVKRPADLVRLWIEDGFGERDAGLRRPGETGSPESVAPVYAREPDADHHIKKMRDPWS